MGISRKATITVSLIILECLLVRTSAANHCLGTALSSLTRLNEKRVHIDYDLATLCGPNQACNYAWDPYYGKTVEFSYNLSHVADGETPNTIFPVLVNSLPAVHKIERQDFDVQGLMASSDNQTYQRAQQLRNRTFSWVRMEVDSGNRFRTSTSQIRPISIVDQRAGSFRTEDLNRDLSGLLQFSPKTDVRGFSLVIASSVPNEPFTPFELAYIDDIYRQLCRQLGVSPNAPESQSILQAKKISPASRTGGDPTSFTYFPYRGP